MEGGREGGRRGGRLFTLVSLVCPRLTASTHTNLRPLQRRGEGLCVWVCVAYSGVRHPKSWLKVCRERGWWGLKAIAAAFNSSRVRQQAKEAPSERLPLPNNKHKPTTLLYTRTRTPYREIDKAPADSRAPSKRSSQDQQQQQHHSNKPLVIGPPGAALLHTHTHAPRFEPWRRSVPAPRAWTCTGGCPRI
jgi:hypothetical protein